MSQLWCDYWVDKADGAVMYENQVIIKSLFFQCIRKVWSLFRAPAAVMARAAPQALMLLDMEDGNMRQCPFRDHLVKGVHQLATLPLYESFIRARDELVRLTAGESRRGILSAIFEEHLVYFIELLSTPYKRHQMEILTLDTLRTNIPHPHPDHGQSANPPPPPQRGL